MNRDAKGVEVGVLEPRLTAMSVESLISPPPASRSRRAGPSREGLRRTAGHPPPPSVGVPATPAGRPSRSSVRTSSSPVWPKSAYQMLTAQKSYTG